MIRKSFAWMLIAGLAGTAAWAQNAEELIEKSLQAMGGREKMESHKTVRMNGKMLMQGMEAPVQMEFVEPDKMRMEITIQGMTMVQAYDGKSGWKIEPFMGKKDAEPMSEQELKAMRDQVDEMNFLTNYKAKGYKVEYVGQEDLEGSPVHKIKITKKEGEVSHVYLDSETNLMVKQTGKTEMQGQQIESETLLSDYKEASGVLYPHSIQTKLQNMPMSMTMTFEKIEPNVDVPATRFEMPKKAEPEPSPAPPK